MGRESRRGWAGLMSEHEHRVLRDAEALRLEVNAGRHRHSCGLLLN